jgi:hypothetical protein
VLGLLLLTTAAATPVRATAQGVLERAELRARLLPDSAIVQVEIRYDVLLNGLDTLPLRTLDFGAVMFQDFQATANGVAVLARSRQTRMATFDGAPESPELGLPQDGALRDGPVRVDLPLALVPGGDPVVIILRYTVPSPPITEAGVRLRVPVVATLWTPVAALPGLVRVTVEVPSGIAVWNPFPSTLRAGRTRDHVTVYATDLPTVPALLAFDVRQGVAPRIPLAVLLDAGVVAFLILFALAGWRHVRESP